jgi:hypothetical protein
MRISSLAIPQPTDVLTTIATHMSAIPLGVLTEARRAEIARNLFGPMFLLVEALQLAAKAGPDEEAVLMHFIASLHAQSELAKRGDDLQRLLARLQARRAPDDSAG